MIACIDFHLMLKQQSPNISNCLQLWTLYYSDFWPMIFGFLKEKTDLFVAGLSHPDGEERTKPDLFLSWSMITTEDILGSFWFQGYLLLSCSAAEGTFWVLEADRCRQWISGLLAMSTQALARSAWCPSPWHWHSLRQGSCQQLYPALLHQRSLKFRASSHTLFGLAVVSAGCCLFEVFQWLI